MENPQTAAAARTVILDDTAYEAPLPEEQHYQELADWLGDRALTRVERMQGKIPEAVYAGRHDAAMRLVLAGVLTPGQPEFDRALQTLEARERLLWIVLHSKYPEVTEEQVARHFRDIVRVAMAEALARALAGQTP